MPSASDAYNYLRARVERSRPAHIHPSHHHRNPPLEWRRPATRVELRRERTSESVIFDYISMVLDADRIKFVRRGGAVCLPLYVFFHL